MSECIVISVAHTQRHHKYITLWRADDAGYAWPLPWAGRYARERVMSMLDYYNAGGNIAVPSSLIEELAEPVDKGDIDNDAGPAVRNTSANWRRILAAVVAEPKYKPTPSVLCSPKRDKPASGAQNEIHAPQNKWEAAIDHELVTMGCTADSFNSPKEALNALIAWHIAVATDPAVKGGYKLAPKTQQSPVHTRAPGAMSNEDLLALLKRFGFEFHCDKYVSGSGYGLLSKPYRLEDFRAILDAARGSNNTLET